MRNTRKPGQILWSKKRPRPTLRSGRGSRTNSNTSHQIPARVIEADKVNVHPVCDVLLVASQREANPAKDHEFLRASKKQKHPPSGGPTPSIPSRTGWQKVIVRKQVRRGQGISFFEALAPCLIGMEACATSQGARVDEAGPRGSAGPSLSRPAYWSVSAPSSEAAVVHI